jgi:hypothetical protein
LLDFPDRKIKQRLVLLYVPTTSPVPPPLCTRLSTNVELKCPPGTYRHSDGTCGGCANPSNFFDDTTCVPVPKGHWSARAAYFFYDNSVDFVSIYSLTMEVFCYLLRLFSGQKDGELGALEIVALMVSVELPL